MLLNNDNPTSEQKHPPKKVHPVIETTMSNQELKQLGQHILATLKSRQKGESTILVTRKDTETVLHFRASGTMVRIADTWRISDSGGQSAGSGVTFRAAS